MAFGTGTISSAGGAVSDLFQASAHSTKAQGLRIEAGNYDEAAAFADRNAGYTEFTTKTKAFQTERDNFKVLGGQQADIASSGLAASGSALDLMRDSAAQGELTKNFGITQGLIQEEGYQVQAKQNRSMADAARLAADAEDTASIGSTISSVFKGAAAVASIFAAPATGGLSLAGLGGMFMGGGSPSGYGKG